MLSHKLLYLDIETDGVNPLVNNIYSVQFALDDGEVEFHDTISGIPWGRILGYISDPNITVVAHNAIMEVGFIYKHHGVMITRIEDTMVLPFIYDRGTPIPEEKIENKQEYNRAKLQSVGLKRMAKHYLNADISEDDAIESLGTKKYKGIVRLVDYLYKKVPIKEAFNHKIKQLTRLNLFSNNNWGDLYDLFKQYAIKDITLMRGLYKMFEHLPRTESYRIEMCIIPHLVKLQLRGIVLDMGKIAAYEKELDEEIAITTDRMRILANMPDLAPSKKQLCAVALRSLGVVVPKTEKGRDGTGKKHLHAVKHEFIELMNRYNTAASRKNNNVKNIYKHTIDGIFYPQYISCGTVHGRMASKNLNQEEET